MQSHYGTSYNLGRAQENCAPCGTAGLGRTAMLGRSRGIGQLTQINWPREIIAGGVAVGVPAGYHAYATKKKGKKLQTFGPIINIIAAVALYFGTGWLYDRVATTQGGYAQL